MAVNIDWRMATAQPNMLAIGNAGFQQGQQQAMQRREQQALQAYAANPDDEAPVNALLAVNPQLAGQLGGMQQQRQAQAQQQQRASMMGEALAGIEGLPEPVQRLAAMGDPDGAMQIWGMVGKMDEQQAAAASRRAEQIARVALSLEGVPVDQRGPMAMQAAQQMGIDPAQLQGLDLSDAGLRSLAERTMGVSEIFKLRDAAMGRQIQMRGQDIQVRGQNISAANTAAQIAAADRRAAMGAGGGQLSVRDAIALEARDEKREKQAAALRAEQSRAVDLIGKVRDARSSVSGATSGLGNLTAWVPGSPARNLEASLDTIKANLGFAELAAMRAASPTGGALGQVTERELTFLQSTVSSLDAGQSPAQLRASLGKIERHYSRWLAASKGINPDSAEGKQFIRGVTGGAPASGGASDIDALVRKYGG